MANAQDGVRDKSARNCSLGGRGRTGATHERLQLIRETRLLALIANSFSMFVVTARYQFVLFADVSVTRPRFAEKSHEF